MTKEEREVMCMALETLEGWKGYMPQLWDKTDQKALTALEKCLANDALEKKAENARELGLDYEPEQAQQAEPVAWLCMTEEYSKIVRFEFKTFGNVTPLYTSPPPRQSLTDEEIDNAVWHLGFGQLSPREVARAIEAKLKAKNSL
jgi:hypothetical protein